MNENVVAAAASSSQMCVDDDANDNGAAQQQQVTLTTVDYEDHFLRPPYTQPAKPNEPLEFMITDMRTSNSITQLWDIEEKYFSSKKADDDDDDKEDPNDRTGGDDDGSPYKSKRKYQKSLFRDYYNFYVKLYGVTAAGNSVCCYLSDWKPYLYIEVPPEWNSMRSIETFLQHIDRHAPIKFFRRNVIEMRMEQRVNIYGFTKGTKIEVLFLSLKNAKTKRDLIEWLSGDPTAHNCYPTDSGQNFGVLQQQKYYDFHIWDGEVDNLQQFINVTNIKPSHWVRLDANQYSFQQPASRPTAERRSRMQIDINAEYKNCRLLPDRVDVPPLIIESWDCETARGALDRQFPQSKVPGDELFQIGTTIWRYGDDKPLYSCVHCVRPTTNLAPDKMHINEFATESAMLAVYLEFTRDKVDADIRLGFNTYGFDNKYLEDRLLLKCSHLYPLNPTQYDRGKFEFGRTRGILSGCKDESNRGGSRAHAARKKFTLDADGRVQLDLYKWSSEEWQFPYGLDRVAKRVLGEQASKADLKFWEVHEKYQQDAQGRGEIADYCRIDTELPLRIINKKQVVLEAIIISRLTCLVIDDVINMRQMVRTFSKLSKAAHDNNYMFPDQPARFVVDPTLRSMMFGTGSYEGAKVFEPKRGFYNMPIATLDFAGLYPSIMRGFRLCYTTLILDPKFLDDPEVEYRTLTIPNANKNLPPFVMHWCTNSQPLVYGILTEINDKRNWAKGEMKKQQKESFLEALYNCWQNNLKLIANSFYGYTGTDAEMNPYTNKAIAASVTAYGREMIVKTKNYVETEEPGSQVIYGDTDSVMIRFPPGMDRAAVFTRAIELAKGVTSLFPAEIKLEFEKVFEPYLLIGKKTYAGYKYTKVEAPDLIDGVLKPMQKGLASVRGDKIPIVRRLTTQVVSALCDDRLPERAIALLEQNLQLLVDDQIDPADFAIEQKLKKDADDYSASTRHAAVAREMAERDIGTAPKSGEKVVYIIAQHKRTGVTKPMAYEYFLEERADYRVDTVYYIENLIVEALGKLLDVPGLSADPYRIFERFVGMAKSKSMRTDMHRFLTADTSTTAVSTTESNVVVLGNGEMPLSKSKMKRDKDLKKRDRADKAKRLGIKPQAVGKGSLAGFLKEM